MRKILTTIALIAGMLMLTVGVTATPAGADHKVFVCKYVGTPGVDERLQTGQNPISVAKPATDSGWFNDAQGRSYVIGPDLTHGGGQAGEPSVSECPAPDGPDKPDDRIVYGDWIDGKFECGENTTVEQARTVTTTTFTYDEDSNRWVEGDPVVITESRTRDLTQDEITTCPTTPPTTPTTTPPATTPPSTTPPEVTPNPPATEKPVVTPPVETPATEAPRLPLAATGGELPMTGNGETAALVILGVALILGGIYLVRRGRI